MWAGGLGRRDHLNSLPEGEREEKRVSQEEAEGAEHLRCEPSSIKDGPGGGRYRTQEARTVTCCVCPQGLLPDDTRSFNRM